MVWFERWIHSTFVPVSLICYWLLFILFYYLLFHFASLLYAKDIICSLSRLVDGILV